MNQNKKRPLSVMIPEEIRNEIDNMAKSNWKSITEIAIQILINGLQPTRNELEKQRAIFKRNETQ